MPQVSSSTARPSFASRVSTKLRTSGRSRLVASVLVFAILGGTWVVLSKAADPSGISASIIKTQYAYPSNAIFVAPSGNNTNSGTLQAPMQTLQAAVDRAATGSTIVMRAGTYRESLKTLAKALTIQPYPNEEVWLDGSDPVTGWVQEGAIWRKDNWTAAGTLCPNGTCYDANLVTAQNPAAGLPDMVFIDGVELKQVLTKAEVSTGTFWVDRNNSQLYIGSSPAGKLVEASTRKEAIFYYSAATIGSKLRGLGVRRYASNLYFASKPAQIQVSNGAKGIEFENMVFTQSSSNGLFVAGSAADKTTGIVIKNSTFAGNGGSGLAGNYVDGARLEGNIFYNNNTQKAQWEGEFGAFAGAKIARMTNSTIRNNLFQGNYGNGYWCDLACRGNAIVGNMARDNLTNGIYYEVSYDGIIVSNVSYANGGAGFKANGRNIKIYNNTAYNNTTDNIFVYDDPRLASQNVEVVNNISAGGARSNTAYRLIQARMNNSNVAEVMKTLDYNLYFRSSTQQPKYVLGWTGSQVNNSYLALDSTLKQQTGREANGLAVDGKAIGTLFKDAAAGDFRLSTGAAALQLGTALPADVAQAAEVVAGTKPAAGAMSWRAGSSNTVVQAVSAPVTPTPPPNALPTVTQTLSGGSFTAPASFTVTAKATDSDGVITKIEILQNNVVVLTCVQTATCAYPATTYGAGTYTYASRAYDNAQPAGITLSPAQTVTVGAVTPPTTTPPPVVPPVTLSAPTSVSVVDGLQFNNYPYRLPLQWSAVTNATSYSVARVGQAPQTVSTNKWTDEGVYPGTVYSYEVRAMQGANQSVAKTVKAQVNCFLFVCWPTIIQ